MPKLPDAENPTTDQPLNIDLAIVARDLRISPENVEKTIQLLDDGNTISFITRFRKDLTGGLNENQILSIKQLVAQQRALAERKAFVLKSIESQGKLTDELKQEIFTASSHRRIEDLYLPFKPQKQSRAGTAKQQGLEPLADDIFSAATPDVDLATRATDFVRVDKGLNSVDDVIRGVADILVERFGENGGLRSSLRQIFWNTGKIVSQVIEAPASENKAPAKTELVPPTTETIEKTVDKTADKSDEKISDETATATGPDSTSTEITSTEVSQQPLPAAETSPAAAENEPTAPIQTVAKIPAAENEPAAPLDAAAVPLKEQSPANPNPPTGENPIAAAPKRKKKKKKKKKTSVDPFKDYHDFRQPIKNLPNHRVLALNRGEKASKLKVKIQADDQQLTSAACSALVPESHPFEEFLKKCAGDSLNKVLLPSLEREARRELTETAEKHAVEVFANNLRNLLLQSPIRNRSVLAIDPGFKSGCGVAVLDPFGNLLESGHIYVVGNQSRRDESKQKIVQWVNQHAIEIIAIGTGAACRQAEQLVSDTIAEHFLESNVRYVMVNEAGASIYSTSEIGREELPDITPSIRSAVSIGRRLQDPLSELVKISPANIGVGMYQHDVKAKHLSESLDEVVEVCVNQVGVNVNTASPSLLKYVSGLNALTARRLVEHRQQINGFKNRQQLKEVTGIGDATFIQAAGFLRIRGGDNPLDSTSIHPESYGIAENVIARVKSTPEELFPYDPDPIPTAGPIAFVAPAPTKDTPNSVADPQASTPEHAAVEEAPSVEEALPAEELFPRAESIQPDPPTDIPSDIKAAAAIPSDIKAAAEVAPAEDSNSDGSESIHSAPPTPSSAPNTTRETLSESDAVLHAQARKEIIDQITKLEIDQIAADNDAGKLLVRDILMALRKPDWDPRDRVQKPIFRRGIIKVDDLKLEMQLDGQIVNVVDFGVFVDIGLGDSSLVHVSQLSNQYVRDPHRFCAVGDVLKVWVSEIDTERRRVKLTAIQPGSKSEKPSRRSHSRRPQVKRDDSSSAATDSKSGQSTSGTGSRVNRFERTRSKQSDDRGRSSQRGRGGKRDNHQDRGDSRRKPHRPSQPAPPITDGMIEGSEPMRSFSDLFQFVQKKPEPTPKGDKKDDKKSS